MAENIPENKDKRYWISKALIYFFILEFVLSVPGGLRLISGANSGATEMNFQNAFMATLIIAFYIALPVALFSIGMALREKSSSSNRKLSTALMVAGTLVFVPTCLLFMLYTFVSQ